MSALRIILLALAFIAFQAHAAQRNLAVTASGAQAQKRVALVIGNAAYKGAPALRNPVNDAKAMSNALNGLGFEVIEVTDATQKEMNRAITAFGSKLNAETAALFFYAGHGMQVRGKNYIIPVDAQIETEAAVASESVSVDTVLEQLNVSTVSIVILDACRNNPFERSFRKMGGGLAQMDAPKGSFIAYATAPGKTAADGDGKNGLFTQELLKQINTTGLSLEGVFKRVRANVSKNTGDAQMPWDSSSMTGDFYFKPGDGTQVASLVPVPSQPARIRSKDEIEQDSWDSVRDSGSINSVQEYLKQYPKGRFAGQARILIATLKTTPIKPAEPIAVVSNSVMATGVNNVVFTRLAQLLNAQGFTSFYVRPMFLKKIKQENVKISDVNIDTCRMQFNEIHDYRGIKEEILETRQTKIATTFDIADIQKISIEEVKEFEDEDLSKEKVSYSVHLEFAYDAVTTTYHYSDSTFESVVFQKKYASLNMTSSESAKKAADLFSNAEKFCKKFVK